jgi:hypothetical protein
MIGNSDMYAGGFIIGEQNESCEQIKHQSRNIICLSTMTALKGMILYVLLA